MDLKRAMYLRDVVREEYLIRDDEQRKQWIEEIKSLRLQLLELGLTTQEIDYILSIIRRPENPNAIKGKITWLPVR